MTKSGVSHFSFIHNIFSSPLVYTRIINIFLPSSLLGIVASKSGVRGCGTKKAPLSVQSPQKHLDLGSSGQIEGNLFSLTA